MTQPLQFWKISGAAALSALLLFQAGGWFLACGILQFQAKKVAHVALDLPETPLCTVTIPVDLLPEIRVGKKEIRLDGRLFDIKNQTVNGDSVTLRLYHDHHEEAVLNVIGQLLAPGSGPNTAHFLLFQNWLAQWLCAAFLLPSAAPGVQFGPDEMVPASFDCFMRHAQNAPDCFSPPPEFRFSQAALQATA